MSEASEDREVEECDRDGVWSGVAEMEFEEDEDTDSGTGICKTVLRENAVVDILEDLAGASWGRFVVMGGIMTEEAL